MLEMQGLTYYVINGIITPSGEITIQLNKDTTNQCKKDVIKDYLCNILKIKFYFIYIHQYK